MKESRQEIIKKKMRMLYCEAENYRLEGRFLRYDFLLDQLEAYDQELRDADLDSYLFLLLTSKKVD